MTLCYFVFVFFSPFSFAITSLGEERAHFSAFRTFVRFAPVWFCLFSLSLSVWEWLLFRHCLFLISLSLSVSEGLCFVIIAFTGYLLYFTVMSNRNNYDMSSVTQQSRRTAQDQLRRRI